MFEITEMWHLNSVVLKTLKQCGFKKRVDDKIHVFFEKKRHELQCPSGLHYPREIKY